MNRRTLIVAPTLGLHTVLCELHKPEGVDIIMPGSSTYGRQWGLIIILPVTDQYRAIDRHTERNIDGWIESLWCRLAPGGQMVFADPTDNPRTRQKVHDTRGRIL